MIFAFLLNPLFNLRFAAFSRFFFSRTFLHYPLFVTWCFFLANLS